MLLFAWCWFPATKNVQFRAHYGYTMTCYSILEFGLFHVGIFGDDFVYGVYDGTDFLPLYFNQVKYPHVVEGLSHDALATD